ncbi:Na+/H+ antiporter subunit E [Maricaulis salignorans]|uniref:Multisubunit sodium/proton antiporter, MrpE subunit n=1 Tax=Maricaulis salignorans TaxID=144026 RepID=A0A1G9Q608_9PROT|nr:Na+/H+ antiporter subunit E [Maricaulis salignorans]SDM06474.1 multisubunit sodium/proton antiporter, MrpE subunit [Maricaulis salignorans]
MTYSVGLTAVLVLLWLTLSGQYTLSGDYPLVIGFGVLSVVATVALTARMRILDRETVPILPALPLAMYWIWLGREILAANLAVVKLVMKPEIDVEPRLVRVPAEQRSGLGHAVFANSITLTPGTVTIDVEEDGFLIHALDTSFTDPAGFAEMGARSDLASDGKRKVL